MSEDYSEVRPSIEGVRSMVTCFDVLEMYDIDVNSNGKITSPWNPEDITPSCHVYEDHVHCFSTGKSGDVIDLVMLFEDCSVQQAIWRLWTKSLRAGKEPGDVERAVRNVVVPDFSEELRVAEQIGWSGFHDRAMPSGVNIQRLRNNDTVLPGDACILIPHYGENGRTVHGVKVRWFDGKKTAWSGSQFTHALYAARTVASTPRQVAWLVEGESDSWALADKLIALDRDEDVYALPCGAATWKEFWLETLDLYRTVVLVLDNDKAGETARNKIFNKVDSVERFQAGGHTKNVYVPKLQYNDLREALQAGWEPPAILSAVA